ncbi:hypothetical protein PHAVU_006G212925 [Phaseolus vulgaris]|uniref:basic blue protein-like n=1 Tax=Phaseolus vulgaris TaxID=3885 RepID=UPI0035CC21DF
MGEGRSMSVTVVLLCMLVLYSEMAHASTYVVGGRTGWSGDMTAWNGKVYKAGDTLLFYYNATQHNVVVVDEGGYNSCSASAGSKTYQTGHDYIQLPKGPSFFISSLPGQCQGGLKLSVTAL